MKIQGNSTLLDFSHPIEDSSRKQNVFSSIASLTTEEITDNNSGKNHHLDTQTIYQKETGISPNPLLDKIVEATTNSFPYNHLDKNGDHIISYKGVTFVGDPENNTLCLGDMSDEDNILSIPLSDGGRLMVNRDNIDQLTKALDMFSPKDINRIMNAISTDAKIKSKELEIENMKLKAFFEERNS